jgi:hypothetical protein
LERYRLACACLFVSRHQRKITCGEQGVIADAQLVVNSWIEHLGRRVYVGARPTRRLGVGGSKLDNGDGMREKSAQRRRTMHGFVESVICQSPSSLLEGHQLRVLLCLPRTSLWLLFVPDPLHRGHPLILTLQKHGLPVGVAEMDGATTCRPVKSPSRWRQDYLATVCP